MEMANKQDITPEIEREFKHLMKSTDSGLLMPSEVVRAAESITSPLHKHFTWDDSIAADKYRLEEARFLIQSFTIFNEELKVEVRAFTSLTADRSKDGGYRWTMDVVKRPDLREQLIETALKELNAVKNKYAHLTELAAIWDAVDKTKQ